MMTFNQFWEAFRGLVFLSLLFCESTQSVAQEPLVWGRVVDLISMEGVNGVHVELLQHSFRATTDASGTFSSEHKLLPLGEQVLQLSKPGYQTKLIRLVLIENRTLRLDPILFELDLSEIETQIGSISLSDQELQSDEGSVASVSGLLQATNDVFLNAAAFDFSATFFRPRGLDNAFGKVLINGIPMNKLFNNRPQWGNWGGLNDAQRHREFSMGLRPSDVSFGGLAGTTNIVMRASQYRKGGRISYAFANRSYEGRVMGSYNTGVLKSGWALSVLASRRFGIEGFQEGTVYEANSFLLSVEKNISARHAINLTAFYTPNLRGRATAITREVEQLKGRRYNPNWGLQQGVLRNSRVREIKEPVAMLNYNAQLSDASKLTANVAYQFGSIGNTRLDTGGTRLLLLDGDAAFIGGARNPYGNYYQRLPSYFLRDTNPQAVDFQLAYLAQQEFIHDGQLDWDALYSANQLSVDNGGNSVYVLQEDRIDDTLFSGNLLFEQLFSERYTVHAGLNFRNLNSENYALLKDVLGGPGYLDVDFFAEGDENSTIGDIAQSNLLTRNRIAKEGERYKYNYELYARELLAFLQGQGNFKHIEFFAAVSAAKKSHQRNGLYENGNYPGERSLGPSENLSFTAFAAKAGTVIKLNGRHILELNGAISREAPTVQNTFTNPRQNNDVTFGLQSPMYHTADFSYIFRSPFIRSRITGFYRQSDNETDIGFYYTENLSGFRTNTNAFVQETVTGISTEAMGAEFGLEAQVTPTFKIKAAASYGKYRYVNNPQLYLTSDDFEGRLSFGDGTVKLENLRPSNGPEQAYQLGIEYRDPAYWWCGTTVNYYSHAFIDVNRLSRTDNFFLDRDGLVFNDLNLEEAEVLLQQEQFPAYYLVNLVGGKSWRIKRKYIGFFVAVNNLLNQNYVTGGFEQGRLSNYRDLKEDVARPYGRIFGSRYFFGNGTTYYLNVYVRF